MQSVTKPNDTVVTSYRDHGHMLACGMEAKGVMAELTGREGGYSRGKGGSMHMFSREKNFYGGHGIVGAQVPIGTGLAFAHRYQGNDAVSLTYFGDGAINQGQVYESFNMAALWQLPVVFVIENNQYGMGTSVNRAAAGRALADRGKAYGIPGMQVDGMDVLTVREAGAEAIAHCREGRGLISLRCRPIVTAAIRCRIRPNTAPGMRSMPCASSVIRLISCVMCSPAKGSAMKPSAALMAVSKPLSPRARISRSPVLSLIRRNCGQIF